MAKFTKVKKRTQPSVHSRAARRAVSPTLKTPQNLRHLSPNPQRNKTTYSTGGITKRKKKVQQTRAQKQPTQKALERAALVADRTDVKKQRSEGQAKVVKNRSKEWEDINASRRKGFEVLGEMEEQEGAANDDIQIELPKRFGDGDVSLDPKEELALPIRVPILSQELHQPAQAQSTTFEQPPEAIPLPDDDVPDI